MSHEKERAPETLLPLTPAVLHILLALADGEKHGYAIMQEAREHVSMGPGTLYGTLDRLLAAGLVVETGMSEDERRRYYRVSPLGKRVLTAETARLQRAVSLAHDKGIRPIEVKA